MVRGIVVLLWALPVLLMAAAPDDITTNQRAWYDAVDIDADGDYTDNPKNAKIRKWSDKSGNGNDILSSGSSRPAYSVNNPSTQRAAVVFDGSNDFLKDDNDIWSGSVSNSDIFIVSKVDRYKDAFVFSSMVTHHHRLSAHLPWYGSATSGDSYYDHGECCGNPARLSGNISPISTVTPYFWQFIANGSTYQAVLQDVAVKLSDNNGVGAYNPTGGSFSLGQKTHAGGNFYAGQIYEAIFYQQNLKSVQRKIISAYLSAKWDKGFSTSATYADVYSGDTDTHGNYDFFVGGIGKESDGSQAIGTSQGLTLSDNDFLNANGKYVVAGVNYLTNTATIGKTENDIPNSYLDRAERTWYIDTTGTGGTVKLSFNATDIGYTVENGRTYDLLYRTGNSGEFISVEVATAVNGVVEFNYLPSDGVYTIGKTQLPSIEKSSCVISDSVNGETLAKRIPNATIRYAIEVLNNSSSNLDSVRVDDTLNSSLDENSLENLQIQNGACDCLGVSSASNNGANGTANGVIPIILDYGSIVANSSKCGYFEVKVR